MNLPEHPPITQHRQKILQIAAQHGASNLRIFGSVARGTATPHSDLDLLVDLDPGRTLLDQIGLQQDLEDLLQCSIDITETDSLHPLLHDRILREAIPL